VVEADAFCDGHDVIAVVLRYRQRDSTEWTDLPMKHLGNDRWRGAFRVHTMGQWHYTIAGWVDHFETWRRDLVKKLDAGQNLQPHSSRVRSVEPRRTMGGSSRRGGRR
jgi:starch synthase (maltosyl-transferring)